MANDLNAPADIGFVGIGAMGAPMARNLAGAGYRLHLFDAAPGAAAKLAAEIGAQAPASLKALGAACDAVITMLPDGNIVRQVLLDGADNVASGLRRAEAASAAQAGVKPGAILIDMSSSSPTGTKSLAADLAAKGIPLVDAPVSGGVPRAVDGSLAIMAGGEAEAVARALPVLAPMGKTTRTGGPGSGHAMKALNNYLSAANLVTACEALIAGQRFGLDPDVMMEILNASSGRNTGTAHKVPAYVIPRNFSSGFALKLMAKDLRLALEVARGVGAESPLLARTSAVYDAALAQMGQGADNTDVHRYLESLVADDASDDDGLNDGG